MTDMLRRALSAVSALRTIEDESGRECVFRMPETIPAGKVLVHNSNKANQGLPTVAGSHPHSHK
jgi:hypothetical protein